MKHVSILFSLLAFSLSAFAQKFDYNVCGQYYFNNLEYDSSRSLYDQSHTMHSLRLTPSVGLLLPQNAHTFHRVTAGVDLLRNMGEGAPLKDMFQEVLLYYNLDSFFKNGGHFEAMAGCFPRSFAEGDYGGPFFDERRLFYDNNLEGLFLKYRNERIFAEVGLDWMGMFEFTVPDRRERFQIFSAGDWNFAGCFHFDWTAVLYHYACSPSHINIVDNWMANPRLRWSPATALDCLDVTVGGLFTYQWDRNVDRTQVAPLGLYLTQALSKWNVHLENKWFLGDDLMPFYDRNFEGEPYGAELYHGDKNFHTLHTGLSWHDRLDLRYARTISGFLEISAGFAFRFGTPVPEIQCPVFRGWQQVVSVRIDLSSLRPAPSPVGKDRLPFFDFPKFIL